MTAITGKEPVERAQLARENLRKALRNLRVSIEELLAAMEREEEK